MASHVDGHVSSAARRLGDQRPGERRRYTGGGWYQEIEHAIANSPVHSWVVGDDGDGRRRALSGGDVTGVVGRAIWWCSGEAKATRTKLSSLR